MGDHPYSHLVDRKLCLKLWTECGMPWFPCREVKCHPAWGATFYKQKIPGSRQWWGVFVCGTKCLWESMGAGWALAVRDPGKHRTWCPHSLLRHRWCPTLHPTCCSRLFWHSWGMWPNARHNEVVHHFMHLLPSDIGLWTETVGCGLMFIIRDSIPYDGKVSGLQGWVPQGRCLMFHALNGVVVYGLQTWQHLELLG